MYILSCYNNAIIYNYSLQLDKDITIGPLYYSDTLSSYNNIYNFQTIMLSNISAIRISPNISKIDIIIYHIYGYIIVNDITDNQYKFLQIQNVDQPYDWSIAIPINKQSKYTYIDGYLIEWKNSNNPFQIIRGDINPCNIKFNIECIMA